MTNIKVKFSLCLTNFQTQIIKADRDEDCEGGRESMTLICHRQGTGWVKLRPDASFRAEPQD
jgi:hypothetical protein